MKSKSDLFLELANPNPQTGISRWVYVTEFIGKYEQLSLGNGNSWGRRNSSLAKKYIIEQEKNKNKIIAIRLNGYNKEKSFNQYIRSDIKNSIKKRKCVMLGVGGVTENTIIEVDHKNGRKNDPRVSNPLTQRLDDFQPLCKAANDIKRQICKECKETDKRWDAKNISGNPYSFYEGDEDYSEELGCRGCYQYDPVEYRIKSAMKLSEEAIKQGVDYILSKLYPELKNKK